MSTKLYWVKQLCLVPIPSGQALPGTRGSGSLQVCVAILREWRVHLQSEHIGVIICAWRAPLQTVLRNGGRANHMQAAVALDGVPSAVGEQEEEDFRNGPELGRR